MNKYLLLTNDTEALPNRAKDNHVKRLMWGEHENGVAGVREMTSVVKEFNGKITYFVDICGALDRKAEVLEVAKWLNDNDQDVELHLHPEYLPDGFWDNTGFRLNPRFMNQYEEEDKGKLKYLIKMFSGELESVIGRKINAYRAGSFRWNAMTLEVLKELDIPMAFNNTQASVALGQCPYASSMQKPFRWSNGIIEVPVTEKNFFSNLNDNWWVRYQYPLCSLVRYRTGLGSIIPYSVSAKDDFLVCLMHSWSFLYRDDEGYEYYNGDQRKEDFRKMLKKMSRDFDIIDSRDLKYLIDTGKIVIDHTEDIRKAAYVPDSLRRAHFTREDIKNKNYAYLSNEIDQYSKYCDNFFSDKRFYYGMSCCLFPSVIHKYITVNNDTMRQFKCTYEGCDNDFKTNKLVISNRLLNKIEKVLYVPIEVSFEVKDFLFHGKLPTYVSAESEQMVMYAVYFHDSKGQRISSRTFKCNICNMVDVPKNTATFSISLRIPEDFKSVTIKYISFTFIDTISTHIIPIRGDAVVADDTSKDGNISETMDNSVKEPEFLIKENSGNGIEESLELKNISYDNYFRLSVHNIKKKANGVVIFFPVNLEFNKKSPVEYPNYSGYPDSCIESDLSDYAVINIAEPFLEKQYGYTGSWFFNEQGKSLLPELAEHVKKILGNDCGSILCTGFSMGADLALQFAVIIGAKYCICDTIHAILVKYRYFRKLGLDVIKSHGIQIPEVSKELENYEALTKKRENRYVMDYYEKNLLTLHTAVNYNRNNIPSTVYFTFNNMNPFTPLLFKEIKRIDRYARKKMSFKIIISGGEEYNRFGCMEKDELIKTIHDLLGRTD